MDIGKLHFTPAAEVPKLLGAPVQKFITENNIQQGVWATKIDPGLADTAAFCAHYEVGLDISANCVIVAGKRGDKITYAACMVLATTRADVNGVIRKLLEAKKVSFVPMETATSLTGMEYGGITPIGLPIEWPILVDSRVAAQAEVIVGSGIRGSKVLISSEALTALPGVRVLDIVKAASEGVQ
jgi:prolyl-tRNA editing enzyme YbaK/EbsC (Cys-tRNA(Pro) deacylase)